MNKRQANRLLNVSRALRESLAPQIFSMKLYVHNKYTISYANGWDLNDDRTGNLCGTPACALGHYASRSDLQRIMKIGSLRNQRQDYHPMFYNNHIAHSDHIKILEHFGITDHQSEELFGMFGCGGAKTAIQAAEYIERFVGQHYTQI